LTGSIGSGTEGGRTTVCAGTGAVTPAVGPCPRARAERPSKKIARVER